MRGPARTQPNHEAAKVTTEPTDEPTGQTQLRLWPGVVIVVLQWSTWLGTPFVLPEVTAATVGMGARLLGGIAVIVWWLFFSRAPRAERWGAFGLILGSLIVIPHFLHESIATGMKGLMYFLFAVPVLSLAFVCWAILSLRLAVKPRRVTLAATIILACGVWTLLRSDGISTDGAAYFSWRSAQGPEDRLVRAADETESHTPVPAKPAGSTENDTGFDWPGFRGPHRDGVVRSVSIATNWSESPPLELWRRPVGPGWSSFAVQGDLLYTQEQRGDDEVVACYNVTSGEPVWRHRDATKFWESSAGAGPRATPAVSDGRVYAFGATGILNALDGQHGTVVWSRNVAADTSAEVPHYGFSSSPLVVNDVVLVAADGLAAYDVDTGTLRWTSLPGGKSYSSPHRATIDGIEQILLSTGAGMSSVSPIDGAVLWEHLWPGFGIVQPALTTDRDILIGTDDATRRIAVSHRAGEWTTEERWTSIRLKPYFNDMVVHDGHAYGFDGRTLASLRIEDGERMWKGGRYGTGQLLLLAQQELLLVVSERGELVLVPAVPDQFTEIARFPAIEGKTWNHPVLVGDVLLVRNGEEMAAFQLPLAVGRL
ncbi:MAG: PQQ-like beta-propeller repeat protein [Thermoanaerobaculia bacterium]|nr:PQQ-like beta-propeller repeat protein [Thermoanaerobaculia bacterium]